MGHGGRNVDLHAIHGFFVTDLINCPIGFWRAPAKALCPLGDGLAPALLITPITKAIVLFEKCSHVSILSSQNCIAPIRDCDFGPDALIYFGTIPIESSDEAREFRLHLPLLRPGRLPLAEVSSL